MIFSLLQAFSKYGANPDTPVASSLSFLPKIDGC